MNSQDAIQQELNAIGSSLPLSKNEQPVFTVPPGYFENFAASVWAKLKNQQPESASAETESLSPLLAAISKHNPFSVPENYFTNLATQLPALADETALPDVLQTHTKQMPYAVPAHYFDTLATQVLAKVQKPQAKVVSMQARFLRYAAAAAVVAVVTIGGIFYATQGPAAIDPATQPDAWIAQKLENVPNRDLEAFLSSTGFNNSKLARKQTTPDARTLLTDVSTPELDAFLREMPAEMDFANIN